MKAYQAKRKILLLGSTGKMGTAVSDVFTDYEISAKHTSNFNAENLDEVAEIIETIKPDILFNAIALHGIEAAEKDVERSILLNTLFPRYLAKISAKTGALLVHLSSQSVFDGRKGRVYDENDRPAPANYYGYTKWGAEILLPLYCSRYYIFRLPVLFGHTTRPSNQFVELMIRRLRSEAGPFQIADDLVTSPTYTLDAAKAIKSVIDLEKPFGVYHIANQGQASLYELFLEIAKNLKISRSVQPLSYRELPHEAPQNTFTPLASVKVTPLRHWKESLSDYCVELQKSSANLEKIGYEL